MKKLIAIMFVLAMVFTTTAMAQCPEGTIPCILEGQDACCPKPASDGVRGDLNLGINGILLAGVLDLYDESKDNFYPCRELLDSCRDVCYKYDAYKQAQLRKACMYECDLRFHECMKGD